MLPEGWQEQISLDDVTIPDGWQPKKLSEVADIRFSNVDKKSTPGEIDIVLCNYLDVYTNHSITNELDFMKATASHIEITRFGIAPGDVIITKDSETPDDIGVPAISLATISNLVCGYHLALIKPDRRKVEPAFLARQIAHERIGRYFSLRLRAHGSTRFGLTASTVAGTPLWLPPLPEQRRIAEILDAADEAIRRTERLIAKLKAVKAGLLHDLLTRGLDEHGRLRDPWAYPEQFRDSPLGRIPREWAIVALEEVAEIVMGQSPPGDTYNQEGRGIPLINGPVEFGDRYPSKLQWTTAPTKFCEPGDILFCVRGSTTGRMNISNDVFCIGRGIAAIRGRDYLAITGFLELLLKQLTENILSEARGSGSTFPSITSKRLATTSLVLPPVGEQKRIVAVLDAHDARIRAEEAALEKLRQVKRGLMDDLLTGRVRVT